nr:zinc knuckle CX2CX4HX4C [Tanacetum cinerariifolium]
MFITLSLISLTRVSLFSLVGSACGSEGGDDCWEAISTSTMNPRIASINSSDGAVGNVLDEAGSNMDTTNATNGNGDASVVTSNPNTSSTRTEKRVEIMDIICNLWDSLLTQAKSMPNSALISSDLVKSDFLDAPIIQSIIVHDKLNTYAGATRGSKPKPNKSKANFRSLSPKNLCEGATFSIPRNVVETKKGKSKSTNGGQFGGPSVKQTVKYEPKATTSAPKKRATNVGNVSKSSSMFKTFTTSTIQGNIPMSNLYSALDDESDEDVENVYDESANLFQSKRTGGSSSTFTDAAG